MTELPTGVPVDHVIDGIYISGARATWFVDDLRQAKITRVLKLYEDIPFFPVDFTTFANELPDGELVPTEVLARGVNFVVEQVAAGNRVLVVCGAGISRSATFVLGALVARGTDLRDAFKLLREKRPIVEPHPAMWKSLITHYDLPYTVKDTWQWSREF